MRQRIDDFLIDRVFQPVADFVARWASCYAIAAFLLTGFDLEHAAWYVFRGDYIWIVVAAIWLGPVTYRAYRLDNQVLRDTLPDERLKWFSMRSLFTMLLPFDVLLLILSPLGMITIDEIGWLSMIVALYFMACRKSPPKRQRAMVPVGAVRSL